MLGYYRKSEPEVTGFCGEGIYPRWVAKRPLKMGLLRSPTGINPLATLVTSPQNCAGPSIQEHT